MIYRLTIEEINERKSSDCKLTALYFADHIAFVKRRVVCRCICGVLKPIDISGILHRSLLSCGCARKQKPKHTLTIQQINDKIKGTRLTVIGFAAPYILPSRGTKVTMCLCQCTCGKQKVIHLSSLTAGFTASCGCMGKRIKNQQIKYSVHNPKIYRCWASIKARCYDPNRKDYPRYGARGVKMCNEWLNDYQKFLDWCLANGWKSGLQVDKDIKGDGLLYSPETCSLVTRKVNCNNMSTNRIVVVNGVSKTLKMACDELGYDSRKYDTVISRLQRGWGIEDALHKPVGKNGRRKIT